VFSARRLLDPQWRQGLSGAFISFARGGNDENPVAHQAAGFDVLAKAEHGPQPRLSVAEPVFDGVTNL
jgi:hypothetical protein